MRTETPGPSQPPAWQSKAHPTPQNPTRFGWLNRANIQAPHPHGRRQRALPSRKPGSTPKRNWRQAAATPPRPTTTAVVVPRSAPPHAANAPSPTTICARQRPSTTRLNSQKGRRPGQNPKPPKRRHGYAPHCHHPRWKRRRRAGCG